MPFTIGPGEIILVLIIALIVVGPGKLPDVGSALGKSIREFRKAATDVKESTTLDTTPTTAPIAPREVAAPATAPAALPPTPPSPAVAVPPAPLAAVPGAVSPAASTPETPPPPVVAEAGASAGVDAAASEWPAEVVPVDEQQPTASA